MIRPSIQARHALARLTLPVMVIAAFGLMLVGKVDTVLVERARIAVYDASAPIYAALAEPLSEANKAVADVVGLWSLRDENARLRKALDEAHAKLDAVTHIERSINDRGTSEPPHTP